MGVANALGKNFDLIVFDWDGTLMDSTSIIATSLQAACRDLGLAVPELARANHVIGLGLSEALGYLVPALPDTEHQRLAERYRYHYFARDQKLLLFDGAREMLEGLRGAGYSIAVATGKTRRGLNHALGLISLQSTFHATRCADESFSKPHPGMLLELLDELMVEPHRALMVGDTTHDVLMARNAGVAAIAVSYGAHASEILSAEGPLAILGSISELRQWIEKNG